MVLVMQIIRIIWANLTHAQYVVIRYNQSLFSPVSRGKMRGKLLIAFLCIDLSAAFTPYRGLFGRLKLKLKSAEPDDDSDSISSFIIRKNTEADLDAGEQDALSDPKEAEGQSRVFDRLVDYPCTFQIKVIGLRQGQFTTDMVDIISRVTSKPSEEIKFSIRKSSAEKYISVSIDAPVASADMLYECYEALEKDPRVKFKF